MTLPPLEQTWRWFGPRDPVTLSHIRQAGATGVVSALHHISCGSVWSLDEINKRKAEIEAAGMRWSVVESVPVHEDIKRATGDAERHIENYCQSLRNLSACGVTTVCYNFMAVTDWTRTDVAWVQPDGSEALRFNLTDAAAFDLHALKRAGAQSEYSPAIIEAAHRRWNESSDAWREKLCRTILLGLPGTVDDLSVEQFSQQLAGYAHIDSEQLRKHHTAFLQRVIPVAEACGVKLAIHPDDPPFPVFGLPRIAGDEEGLRRIVDAYDSPSNGITFCSGSLGSLASNDLPGILRRLGDRVHFLHLRNVTIEPDGGFYEDDHLRGSADMAVVMQEVINLMARRGVSLPMRPDHGRRMLGDLQQNGFYAGYSAIGRLRGLAELRGLEHGLRSVSKHWRSSSV